MVQLEVIQEEVRIPREREREDNDVQESTESSEEEVIVVKKSYRSKKTPVRLKDYHMYQATRRTRDKRLQAWSELFSSGVLENVSADIAHRLIQSINSMS